MKKVCCIPYALQPTRAALNQQLNVIRDRIQTYTNPHVLTIVICVCQVFFLFFFIGVIFLSPNGKVYLMERCVIIGTAGQTEQEPDCTSGHVWASLWSHAAINSTGSMRQDYSD